MLQPLLLTVVGVLAIPTASAFSTPSSIRSLVHPSQFDGSRTSRWNSAQSRLLAQYFESGEFMNGDEEEEELIAKEQLFRGMMFDESSKKKPKGKQKAIKKPHDNRDNLPFLVQVLTPPTEPYETIQKKKKKSKKQRRRGDYDDPENDDGSVVGETLGEFKFEKNTGSGDKIEIDEQVYLVTRAKCQYRYAGAQKFEMVRKILQVKPVQRAMQEDYILRQFNAPSARESD